MSLATKLNVSSVSLPLLYPHFHSYRRPLSTSRSLREDEQASGIPRWKATPKRMKAPYRMRPEPSNNTFIVNEDPYTLDKAYKRLLGANGDKILSEERKWQAVTHKSFDQGRRGHNEILACYGNTKPAFTFHKYLTEISELRT